jgi:hypothetical protein
MHADSLKHHIKHLEDVHSSLNRQVDTLEKTGKFDDKDIMTLKRKRLHVKDELARCRQTLEGMLK